MKNPLITRLRLLTSLSEDSLEAIASAFSSTQSYPAHTNIVREGHVVSHIHVVLDGWCGRYRILLDGRRQFPALHLPGDICDLDALLLRRVDFGISSITACTVALLPREQLRMIIDQNFAIRDAFWWLTFVQNAVASEWAVGLGRRSTQERFAHLICELMVRLTAVNMAKTDSFAFPLTQEELGDALGVSTVHINRTLQELRSKNLITLEDHVLTICHWEALRTLAGFSPTYLHVDGHSLAEQA